MLKTGNDRAERDLYAGSLKRNVLSRELDKLCFAFNLKRSNYRRNTLDTEVIYPFYLIYLLIIEQRYSADIEISRMFTLLTIINCSM